MNKTLLIVEDNEDLRVFMERALAASGYDVMVAINGVDALSQLQQQRPDLIISDILMPRMDGFELCRHVKEDERYQAIPLVFYTATYLDAENRELGLSLGAARYLSKPMELPELLANIEEVIEESQTTESVQPPSNVEAREKLDEMYEHSLARKLDQKVAELERTRHYLRSVFDYMPSLLIGVDHQGNVQELNGEAQLRGGVSLEEARGKPIWQMFPYLEAYSARILHALALHQPLNLSRLKYNHSGTTGFIDVVLYPLEKEKDDGAVIRVDDVSERVRLEETMIQTEKMLSVGVLAAGMAHEINNPLAGITLGVQNILRRIDPELSKNREVASLHGLEIESMIKYLGERKVFEMLEGVKDAAARAGNIIDNMLHFSRKSNAEFELVRLDKVLDETLEMAALDYDLKTKYDFRNITITKHYSDDMPEVPCIASEIKQVLLNLFRNAAQAMYGVTNEDNPPNLMVSCYQRDERAIIEVADNGPGMSQETQRRIFDPFFTTKAVGSGTGLGLFIAYFIIVDTHGGSIEVESELKHGAKFIIELPVERQL